MSVYLADIGNTAIKIYSLDKECFIYAYEEDKAKLTQFLARTKPERLLVSAVSERGWVLLNAELKTLAKGTEVQRLDQRAPFAFTIGVEHPETVGVDRLINIEAALVRGFQPPLVIVCAGSAITIDTVFNENGKSVFKGGLIIPGEKLQKQALQAFTSIPAHLIFKEVPPAASDQAEIYPLWGKNSTEAISYGIRNCLLYGVNEVLARLKKKCILSSLIFTGGNGKTLFDDLVALGSIKSQESRYERELAYAGLLSLGKKLQVI